MSTQPLQQQQPVVVYPNTVSGQSSSSHSSNGSFAIVFIVLAVIAVVSAIACCLGRLCNKGQNKQKSNKHNQQQNFRSKEREKDIEFGFDKRFPTGRSGGNGDHAKGDKTFENGHIKGEINSVGNDGPKGGP